jgi:hypothetical protein
VVRGANQRSKIKNEEPKAPLHSELRIQHSEFVKQGGDQG